MDIRATASERTLGGNPWEEKRGGRLNHTRRFLTSMTSSNLVAEMPSD